MSSMNAIIANYSNQNVKFFFENKITSFKPEREVFTDIVSEDSTFLSPVKIGQAELKNHEELIVFTCESNKELTARSAKKQQFEIAKKVLKEDFKDGAIFIFYDTQGNFRFSFIRKNYGETVDNKYTPWKRYTYYVEPSKQNKTFKDRIDNCSFQSLDTIQEAFSVEPLNKKFYEDIAKAFFELISGKYKAGSKTIKVDKPLLKLPSTPYQGNENIYKEFAVRLIGRTIFCWFLKNKKSSAEISLIPESLLSSTSISVQHKNYYHDVLEKLFFLVLNKKIEDRKGYELPPEANTIPFLNGGLFEAHQDDFFTNNKANFALKIPDIWFKDLFETLEQYNFTIDENSINDSEVSIDPEMLGTIFENLLAEIDPDTEKSARKATGSFYTPREIVDYMVEQSLVQYLKTKTNVTDEETLEQLFQEGETPNNKQIFSNTEKEDLLKAISTVKILDPACGSGAFPMGAVNKIILALEKLDPDAEWWKEQQVRLIPNPVARKNLKTKLEKSTSDYARKLGVIQNSIYGVDIQPIAAEISKLRSFLSLVIDENIDDDAENRGIEPLPNLEFKFVTANTLLGLPEAKDQQLGMFDDFEELQALEQLREEYLQSYGDKKQKIKEQFLKTQKKAFKGSHNLFADQNSRSYKLISWNPFNNEKSSWFDPQWMFGVDKFDIVIGNPPYGVSVKGDFRKNVLKQLAKVPDYEIYYFFIEVSKKFLIHKGTLTYIIPNTFLFNVFASNYREKLLDNWALNIIDCTAFKIFDKATVLNAIIFSKYDSGIGINFKKTKGALDFQELISRPTDFIPNEKILKFNQNWSLAFRLDENIINLIKKLKDNSRPLIEFFPEISQGLIAYDKYRGQDEDIIRTRAYHYNSFSKPDLKKWLRGGDITKFNIKWNNQEWIDYCDGIANPRNPKFFKNERILIREITNPSIFAAYTEKEYYHDPALLVILNSNLYNIWVLLGFLNSKLATFFHFNHSPKATKGAFPKIIIEDVKNFPLMKLDKPISICIESITREMYLKPVLCEKLFMKLDVLIYKLYSLTYQEVLIVDPQFILSREEFENFEV